jgi:hypothetical protein
MPLTLRTSKVMGGAAVGEVLMAGWRPHWKWGHLTGGGVPPRTAQAAWTRAGCAAAHQYPLGPAHKEGAWGSLPGG